MQAVFAEKTEDRSLDDNRHIGRQGKRPPEIFCTGRMRKKKMYRSILQGLTDFCCIWMKPVNKMACC